MESGCHVAELDIIRYLGDDQRKRCIRFGVMIILRKRRIAMLCFVRC